MSATNRTPEGEGLDVVVVGSFNQFQQPGMQSVTVKAPREGAFPGEINVTVQPTVPPPPGIFVRSNYHYTVPPATGNAGGTDLLLQFLKSEWDAASGMARRVANTIFDRIRPDHD